jgi:hypothetical protein
MTTTFASSSSSTSTLISTISPSLNNEQQQVNNNKRSIQLMHLLTSDACGSFLINWPIDIIQMVIDYEISPDTHIYIIGGCNRNTEYIPNMGVIVIPFDPAAVAAVADVVTPIIEPDLHTFYESPPRAPYCQEYKQILPSMPGPRGFGYAHRLKDVIYVSGGYTAPSSILNPTIDHYDIPSQAWAPTTPMGRNIYQLHGFVVIPFVNHGGTGNDDIDPLVNHDHIDNDMALPTTRPTTTTTDCVSEQEKNNRHCLMSIGHHYNGEERCERYDPLTKQLSSLAPLPSRRRDYSTAVLNNRVYVFGGEIIDEASSECFVYDVINNKWSSISSLPQPRFASASVVTDDDTILVMGGRISPPVNNDDDPVLSMGGMIHTLELDTIVEYKPSTNKWRRLSWKLPYPCSYMRLIYDKISNRLIIMAGCHPCDSQLNEIGSTYFRNKPFDNNEWIKCEPNRWEINGFAYCT